MKTKITLIVLVFTLFSAVHYLAVEKHDTKILEESWISEATEQLNAAWRVEILDCPSGEDVYAQLAGGD